MMAPDDPNAVQEIIGRAYALAYENEQKYGCCPQCVLAAIQDVLGIVDDATFKASHGLAGGGGLSTGGTCGALSGGMLALSARYGRDRAHFGDGRFTQSYRLGKRLYDRFVAEFGSPLCAEVQTRLFGRPFDMWDAKDYRAFEEAGGHRDKCPSVTGRVASWTAEMLIEAQQDAGHRVSADSARTGPSTEGGQRAGANNSQT
jgi:C_GCAxxG_C_C family probable redox protein